MPSILDGSLPRNPQDITDAPTQTDTSSDGFDRESCALRPFLLRQGQAAEFEATVASGIPHLGRLRSPADIAGSIIAVIVDSIDTMFWRTRPHMRQKTIEGLKFRRYFYSATSVILIARVFGILAALFHGRPYPVFAALPEAMPFRHGFWLEASA